VTIDPKYSIGIDEVDAQHARWIQLIEEFKRVGSAHLLDHKGFQATQLALEKLLAYTKSHFVSEEKLIDAHGYPDLEAHKKKHRELEAKVVELLDEVHAHSTNRTPLKLNLLVTIWLMEHILQEDDKFARFILGKPQLEPLPQGM
jgi:hemerythrin